MGVVVCCAKCKHYSPRPRIKSAGSCMKKQKMVMNNGYCNDFDWRFSNAQKP